MTHIQTTGSTPSDQHARKVRDLHVKAIPADVWVRARCNATQSGMSFKEYVIRLLGTCRPMQSVDETVPSEQ